MNLQPFSWMILVFIGLFLLTLAYVLFSLISKKAGTEKVQETGIRGAPGICPICGSFLKKGEQVKSALYEGTDDRLCYIYGCPHCYPLCESGLQRKCPVCNKKMGQETHLIARYFERKNNKKRVHILGCANCRFRN